MSEHTKGPWTLELPEGWIKGESRAVGRFHAGREDAGNDARPRKSDMALILAAPDLLAACESAIAEACACVECGAPGARYFLTEGDGPFWLCSRVRVGDSEHGDHAMPERYAGEEVLAPDRPLDAVRAAIKKARGK